MINELCETFIYLCDQHGILIQATSITDTSFNFKPNIIRWNEDVDLMAKCKDLAVSVGLDCDGDKCFLKVDKPKIESKKTDK
jgi:hypothetical protein